MSNNNIEYTQKEGEDSVTITEDGFITSSNIAAMKFSFKSGQDITESLHKKNSKTREEISTTKKGRTGYSPLTCTYPDKTSSAKVVLTGCVVQWREGIDRENSTYARDYVCIGIPTIYLNKISADAKTHSSMNIGVKSGVSNLEGCYWLSCTLDKLAETDTWIVGKDDEGNDIGARGTVFSILKGVGKSITATVMFTCSGSMATDLMEQQLDLENGKYTYTLKPTEMYLKTESNKIGPVLKDTTDRKKEKIDVTESLAASGSLISFAMKNLSI